VGFETVFRKKEDGTKARTAGQIPSVLNPWKVLLKNFSGTSADMRERKNTFKMNDVCFGFEPFLV